MERELHTSQLNLQSAYTHPHTEDEVQRVQSAYTHPHTEDEVQRVQYTYTRPHTENSYCMEQVLKFYAGSATIHKCQLHAWMLVCLGTTCNWFSLSICYLAAEYHTPCIITSAILASFSRNKLANMKLVVKPVFGYLTNIPVSMQFLATRNGNALLPLPWWQGISFCMSAWKNTFVDAGTSVVYLKLNIQLMKMNEYIMECSDSI